MADNQIYALNIEEDNAQIELYRNLDHLRVRLLELYLQHYDTWFNEERILEAGAAVFALEEIKKDLNSILSYRPYISDFALTSEVKFMD